MNLCIKISVCHYKSYQYISRCLNIICTNFQPPGSPDFANFITILLSDTVEIYNKFLKNGIDNIHIRHRYSYLSSMIFYLS